MFVEGFKIPKRLLALLDMGLWPRTADQTSGQNLRPLVLRERIHLFAPDESMIYLYAPPFHTLAREIGSIFWSEFGALAEILPEAAVLIADFGIGSDSPIVLDYRANPDSPAVLRLAWTGGGETPCETHWVSCAANFDEFADLLALEWNAP